MTTSHSESVASSPTKTPPPPQDKEEEPARGAVCDETEKEKESAEGVETTEPTPSNEEAKQTEPETSAAPTIVRARTSRKTYSEYKPGGDVSVLIDDVLNSRIQVAALVSDEENPTAGDDEVCALAYALMKNRGVHTVAVTGSVATDQSICGLLKALERHPTVTALTLNNNPIDDIAGHALLDLVRTNKNLVVVEAFDTNISDDLLDDIDSACQANYEAEKEAAVLRLGRPVEAGASWRRKEDGDAARVPLTKRARRMAEEEQRRKREEAERERRRRDGADEDEEEDSWTTYALAGSLILFGVVLLIITIRKRRNR
eukprot:PhM_4_TR2218/c0_g1_i1/m.7879